MDQLLKNLGTLTQAKKNNKLAEVVSMDQYIEWEAKRTNYILSKILESGT